MASSIKVSVDVTDLKVLNDYLNTTEDKIDLTAKTAKKSFSQLKMAIDPAYRATKVFKEQVLIAQKAVSTGAITQKEYSQTFAQIQKQAAQAGVTINQFGQVADVNTRKVKKFGAVGMQQVGYQVQDFAVQVQGGTSALVALGQQGSQLLGIFGPYGAIAGMILAIGTGLAGAFMAAKNAGDESVKTFGEYKDVIDEAKKATTQLRLETFMLTMGIKDATEAKLRDTIASLKQQAPDARSRQKYLREETLTGKIGGYLGVNPFSLSMVGQAAEDKRILDNLKEAEATLKSLVEGRKKFETADETFGTGKEDREKSLQVAKELALASFDRAQNAKASYDANAEDLLILKQANEAEALRRKIISEKIDIMGVEAQFAITQLKSAHDLELAEFRRLEAIKAAEEADRKAKQALADKNKQDAKNLQKLIDKYKQYQGLVNDISRSVEDGLVSIAERTKTVEEAFKDMAADIIRQLYRVLVVQQMVGSFNAATGEGSGLAGFFGGMFKPRANGGPVTAGQPYLVGERGPELFVPSSNGGVVANDKMGGGVTVVQNLNISTGVSQTVRAEIRNLMPQIAETAKSAVVDSKRRGGNYGKAFA